MAPNSKLSVQHSTTAAATTREDAKKTNTMNVASTTSVASLETLLELILCEYQQVATTPSGDVTAGVVQHERPQHTHAQHQHHHHHLKQRQPLSLLESIQLSPACHPSCPCNFGTFFRNAKRFASLQQPSVAFAWYCRCRLRFSCSTLTAGFVRYLVPQLKARGIEHVPLAHATYNRYHKNTTTVASSSTNQTADTITSTGTVATAVATTTTPSYTFPTTVCLANLRIQTIVFTPHGPQHALDIYYGDPYGTEREIVDGPEEALSHQCLQCRLTGLVVDLSIGQFTGRMEPRVYANLQHYLDLFPGTVVQVLDVPESDIDDQIVRDEEMYVMARKESPDVKPVKFARRVVQSWLELQNKSGSQHQRQLESSAQKRPYCSNCFGIATKGATLSRCARCKHARYCSKECQIMHWPIHKETNCLAQPPQPRQSTSTGTPTAAGNATTAN